MKKRERANLAVALNNPCSCGKTSVKLQSLVTVKYFLIATLCATNRGRADRRQCGTRSLDSLQFRAACVFVYGCVWNIGASGFFAAIISPS